MNDNEQGGLAFLVGELRGELRGLHDVFIEMRNDIEQASNSRRLIHEKLDAVDRRMERLESTVTVMGGVVDKQTKRVDKIEPLALWLIAIAGGLLLVGGALWYGVLNYGVQFVQWLGSMFPPKP